MPAVPEFRFSLVIHRQMCMRSRTHMQMQGGWGRMRQRRRGFVAIGGTLTVK